jgi:1-acyl-sn-glycerol-3-phosphate acyltransferase
VYRAIRQADMDDPTYFLIASMIRLLIWQGWKKSTRLQDADNLPSSGPAVFIGNHASSLGPIGCVSMLPLRLYPWARPEMLDPRRIPAYLRVDFVEKDLGLRPPLSGWLADALSRVVAPLLNSAGCLPAFQSEQILEKRALLRQSLAHLGQGRCLLVFPEVPEWELDPRTRMRRFSRGVLWLAALYQQSTGNRLPFYPVCIHPAHRIRLGPAVLLGEAETATQAKRQACIEALEEIIRGMYLEIEREVQSRA